MTHERESPAPDAERDEVDISKYSPVELVGFKVRNLEAETARLRRELAQARTALEELDTYTESDWGEGLGQRLIRKTLAALQRGTDASESMK